MQKTKRYLAAYDIKDPKRLLKISKVFSCYGVRVQKSLFEIECTEQVIQDIRKEIKEIIDTQKDCVAFIEICVQDWQKKEMYGIMAEGRDIAIGSYAIV